MVNESLKKNQFLCKPGNMVKLFGRLPAMFKQPEKLSKE